MGRNLKLSEPLTKRISVRLTENDYKKYLSILKSSEVDGKLYTASDFVRDSIYNRPIKTISTRNSVNQKPSKCDNDRLRMLVNT